MSDAVKPDRDNRAICDSFDLKQREKLSLKRGKMTTLIQSTFLFDIYSIAFMSFSRWCECPSESLQVFQATSWLCAWGHFPCQSHLQGRPAVWKVQRDHETPPPAALEPQIWGKQYVNIPAPSLLRWDKCVECILHWRIKLSPFTVVADFVELPYTTLLTFLPAMSALPKQTITLESLSQGQLLGNANSKAESRVWIVLDNTKGVNCHKLILSVKRRPSSFSPHIFTWKDFFLY